MIKKIKQFLCSHNDVYYYGKEELQKDIIYNARCKKCGLGITIHRDYENVRKK